MADFLVAASDETPPSWDGLGLWIIRRLVTEENGSIELTEAKGLTTVIRVTWPFRREANLEHESNVVDVGEALHAG
jgi:sensor histidine kinase regulating citrate/malate metabolism